MPTLLRPAYRLDLWSAPKPAGGVRVAWLVDPGAGRCVTHVRRARSLEPGQSQLSFKVSPSHPQLALLQPQQGVVRFTRFVPGTLDTYDEVYEEWRVVRRVRPVQRVADLYEIVCVPLEDDLLDLDLFREVSAGGLARWRFGATALTPTAVLTLLRDRLVALGHSWIAVGTVTPTTPVTFALEQAATPRAVVSALLEALAAQGVEAEFQFTRATDGSEYRLELVTRVNGSMAPLLATTDAAAIDVVVDEDASDQVNVVIPFGDEGADLRELQVEVQAVDGGTGWVTLRALGATPADIVAVDDQWNGLRLFRELTGRSFAILDSTADPMRVQLAAADLASGLAAGERLSFRASEDLAGTRRAFGTRVSRSPLEVVSTLTGPARINTQDLHGAGATIAATNQYRDWTCERSTLVAALPSATFDPVAGTVALASAPSSNPAIGDWIWCSQGEGIPPLNVLAYDSGTRIATVEARYVGHPFTVGVAGVVTARCYRPVAGATMWIQSSLVSGSQLQVAAFVNGTPAATDVLELVQRHQGVRLVEVTDPVAITATRRRVGTQTISCTGATNRCTNADMAIWTGASGDPPDGWSIESIVGSVVRTRVTDPLLTRYGGKSWQLAFAVGASAELFTPLIPVHSVPGMAQVSGALALLFAYFTGGIPIEIRLYSVTAGGTRTALVGAGGQDTLHLFPPDTAADVDAALKPALDQWYDAVMTTFGIDHLADEQLQFGIRRPAGGSNPACTLLIDAAMLLQREGLPQAPEGGVRYVFGSDALPMLSAAQTIMRDRARPLLRFEGKFLDLYRLDKMRYAPAELAIGRDVQLSVPVLSLTRTVRLLSTTEDPDDERTVQVVLERVRPDVGRLLAAKLFPTTTTTTTRTRTRTRDPVPVTSLPYASLEVLRTAESATQITLQGTSTCPGQLPPQIMIASVFGCTIASGPSVGTPAASGQSWVINRPAAGAGVARAQLETVGTGFVRATVGVKIEEQAGANDLTGTELAVNVVYSSLTSVGTLESLDISGDLDALLRTTRTGAQTATVRNAALFQHRTTGDMADGFGVSLDLGIRDVAGVDNTIATIRARRTGADNSGSLDLVTWNAGAEVVALSFAPAGAARFISGVVALDAHLEGGASLGQLSDPYVLETRAFPGGSLAANNYEVGITSLDRLGNESFAQQVTINSVPASGRVEVDIVPIAGAVAYRTYIRAVAGSWTKIATDTPNNSQTTLTWTALGGASAAPPSTNATLGKLGAAFVHNCTVAGGPSFFQLNLGQAENSQSAFFFSDYKGINVSFQSKCVATPGGPSTADGGKTELDIAFNGDAAQILVGNTGAKELDIFVNNTLVTILKATQISHFQNTIFAAAAPATSGTNYGSRLLEIQNSVWETGAPVTHAWRMLNNSSSQLELNYDARVPVYLTSSTALTRLQLRASGASELLLEDLTGPTNAKLIGLISDDGALTCRFYNDNLTTKGDYFIIAAAGAATFATSVDTGTAGYLVSGVKVVGAQGAAVADATDAASVITQLNLLLARNRGHGLIAA